MHKHFQLENSGTFAHENKFSILASDDDEKSLVGCEEAKHVAGTKCQTWISGGERDDEFSCRDE